MRLAELIETKRDVLLERWFEVVSGQFPPQAALFLKNQPNRFANPMGGAFRECLSAMMNFLLTGEMTVAETESLTYAIKVLAVQDAAPSTALAFIPAVKAIVREQSSGGGLSAADWQTINELLDGLMLKAFDLYSAERERLSQVRTGTLHRQFAKLIERAGGESQPPEMVTYLARSPE